MWILTVLIKVTIGAGGTVTQMYEYQTKQDCYEAMKSVEKTAYFAVCAPKK